jgi:hypothetical protein
VKRIRDENKIKSLTNQVEEYEKILRNVESEVDGPTARKIRQALKVSTINNPAPCLLWTVEIGLRLVG